jgi:integrase
MATTARGHIEKLPDGSFRVHVYAGIDPVTGKPRRLKRTCPDEATAAAALGQLLGQADGDRFPDREATLGQALDKYLEVADLEVSTREAHEGYVRRTIRSVLGEVKIRKLPLYGWVYRSRGSIAHTKLPGADLPSVRASTSNLLVRRLVRQDRERSFALVLVSIAGCVQSPERGLAA